MRRYDKRICSWERHSCADDDEANKTAIDHLVIESDEAIENEDVLKEALLNLKQTWHDVHLEGVRLQRSSEQMA